VADVLVVKARHFRHPIAIVAHMETVDDPNHQSCRVVTAALSAPLSATVIATLNPGSGAGRPVAAVPPP
jgi:hypothetical protein